MNKTKKIMGVILGHTVGDALGVPVEFVERERLQQNPVMEMRGFGSYPYPAGYWSDDTSMTLAALDSLAKGHLNFDDVMKKFGLWYYHNEYTPSRTLIDVGNTCSIAIDNYFTKHLPFDNCGLNGEEFNGNGALMRILPFALFAYYNKKTNWEEIIDHATALTHAHNRAKLANKIYSLILFCILENPAKQSLHFALKRAKKLYKNHPEFTHFQKLTSKNFDKLPSQEISSSGYVLDTLEAAVWCVLTTNSFSDCVLKAVNLGDDTDTTAAVAGGLAGALYGFDAIPQNWLDTIKRCEYIENMCKIASENWI